MSKADALKEIREALEDAIIVASGGHVGYFGSYSAHMVNIEDSTIDRWRAALARLSELEAAEEAQAPEEPCECDGDSAPHSHRKPPAPREPVDVAAEYVEVLKELHANPEKIERVKRALFGAPPPAPPVSTGVSTAEKGKE